MDEAVGEAASAIVRTEAAANVTGANVTHKGDRFFLDVGMSSASVKSSVRTKHLEKKGWSGVCAVPFPGDFRGRTCKLVALPVGPESGERVRARDCAQGVQGLQGLMNMIVEVSECPEVETVTVGVGELLAIAAAPKVIDYIALSTQGSELQILRKFPFDTHCARAWGVRHGGQEATKAGIRHFLEVAQGCRVVVGVDEVWARCPCESRHRAAAAPVTPVSHAQKHPGGKPEPSHVQLEINAAGKQRRGSHP